MNFLKIAFLFKVVCIFSSIAIANENCDLAYQELEAAQTFSETAPQELNRTRNRLRGYQDQLAGLNCGGIYDNALAGKCARTRNIIEVQAEWLQDMREEVENYFNPKMGERAYQNLFNNHSETDVFDSLYGALHPHRTSYNRRLSMKENHERAWANGGCNNLSQEILRNYLEANRNASDCNILPTFVEELRSSLSELSAVSVQEFVNTKQSEYIQCVESLIPENQKNSTVTE